MSKLEKVFFAHDPRIAVSVTDREPNKVIAARPIDVLEIRVDLFKDLDLVHIEKNIVGRKRLGVPLLLTVRNARAEGAKIHFSNRKKLKIFERCAPLVDAVDIELRSALISQVIRLARKHKKIAIVSVHNFKNTPSPRDLKRILHQALAQGADIVKMAVYARCQSDVARLLQFTFENKQHNLITMSLGNLGAISRMVAPMFGSLLTYSYVDQPTAPGQISLKLLQEQFRIYYPGYKQR